MRRPARKRESLARVQTIEERLALPVPEPLAGQETIPAELFSETSREHREPHQLVAKDDRP